ncbi:zinc ribbon domain-containing protein [Chloroflexus sp.]|uniref:zinc ribbon domain-containing protein n=1 Tax=Chloroflexus sp. TaxID=1904827 RepID=UPI002ACDE634|nr:zinc ribbon domain-containing protein [Chloroflexus sp.]
MVERICPACRHGNPLENRYCGACGAALTGNEALAPREPSALAPRTFPLSPAQMRQLGTALALGAATLAIEVGKAWLRRRINAPAAAPITTVNAAPITAPSVVEPVSVTTTIISQRVVEIWERGELVRQVVERHVWRRE